MVAWLDPLFPRLRGTSCQVTSPATDVYNCIAWAAGSMSVWWWPQPNAVGFYWPPSVVREESIEAFRDAFATLGHVVCADDGVETGFEKIALFADANNLPTHAARQLANGRWTSKMGQGEDIEHDLQGLEGGVYGSVVLFMKRPTT